ncbi:imelysin family protein [Amorphus sp. 3PC139-8]|uniref:imelysin family protein n=1 Tax=Amorphus sp. 3PC139-8 TaxID=2735676 RepID=UPI00345CFA51
MRVEPAAAQLNRPVESTLSAVVEGYIRPGYAALADASNSLQAATVRYCANPSDTTRAAVDESFRRTVQALGAVAFIDFGPAGINRRLERLNTPAPEKDGEENPPIVAGDGSQAGPEDVGALAQEPPQIQGLPAFERLLVAAPAEPGSDRFAETCRFAGLVAANVRAIATALDSDWAKDGGYGDWLAAPAPDNPVYPKVELALEEVLAAFVRGTRAAGDRLQRFTADQAAGAALGPFDRSQLVMLYQQAEVRGLGQFFQAVDLVDATEPPYRVHAERVAASIGEASAALAEIKVEDSDKPSEQTIAAMTRARAALMEAGDSAELLSAELAKAHASDQR